MYFVAVVCAHRGVAMPDGYALSQSERETIASQLTGIPITVQHANVRERVGSIPATQLLTPALMQETLDSCGLVIAAWVKNDGAVMAIFFVNNQCQRVIDLIKMGQLSCVSLTHVEATSTPVELTLCTIPARPGSTIVLSCADLKEAYSYKASSEVGVNSNMETAADVVQKTPLQTILEGLPAEDRKLVEARMTAMMQAVDTARGQEKETLAKMENLQKMTDVDRQLMKSHLDQWREAVKSMEGSGAQLADYGLAVGDNGVDMAMQMLEKADGGVQHTISNIIKCASASMMQRRSAAVPRTPVAKRKAPSQMPDEPAAEEAEPACATALERAMAAQFA